MFVEKFDVFFVLFKY